MIKTELLLRIPSRRHGDDGERRYSWSIAFHEQPLWRVALGRTWHKLDMAIDKPLHKLLGRVPIKRDMFGMPSTLDHYLCLWLDLKCYEINHSGYLGSVDIPEELAAKINPEWVSRER